jgi:16S rRNA (adenine1518-N6/adenine1519-N6)-dimethyltransferase
MISLLDKTKDILRGLNISPKKRFGQNFMVDACALSAIADAVRPEEKKIPIEELTLIEIGPGLGFLTRALLEKGLPVVAIEKDRIMAGYLKSHFTDPNLRVIERDVLTADLSDDLQITGAVSVAGNIPYNITSPILEWLIVRRQRIRRAVLTVQAEVAARIASGPGTKSWGTLSIFIQLYADVSIVRKIPRQFFYPAPKVDSALLKLDFLAKPRFDIKNEEAFFQLVRKSFQKRRKTILNSLVDEDRPAFSKKILSDCLSLSEIASSRRPETLSIKEWALLCDRIVVAQGTDPSVPNI